MGCHLPYEIPDVGRLSGAGGDAWKGVVSPDQIPEGYRNRCDGWQITGNTIGFHRILSTVLIWRPRKNSRRA